MRFAGFLAILFVAVMAADKFANHSALARSADRNLIIYGQKPAQIADQAMSIIAPDR